MAIRTITWTVDEDMRVTPTRVQDAGVQGDDNATRVVFSLPAFLQDGYTLYLEYVDGVSGYDKTDPLPVSDGAVSFALPLAWTQHGGEATVRLVAEQDGVVAYTADGRVRYEGRRTAFAKIKSLIEGSIQAAQDRIAKMIADAKVWIDNVNGVYVGSGDMPDSAVIQIDPEGEALLLDNAMSDTSENVPKTKVVKAYVDETAKELENYVDETAKELLDMVYPVGSIYMSVNAADPSALFGGTWKQLKDRFLLGAGDSYAAGETGGEATHALTTEEMPTHSHGMKQYTDSTSGIAGATKAIVSSSIADANYTYRSSTIAPTGGNAAHNNMPPYLTVYMWQRVV